MIGETVVSIHSNLLPTSRSSGDVMDVQFRVLMAETIFYRVYGQIQDGIVTLHHYGSVEHYILIDF